MKKILLSIILSILIFATIAVHLASCRGYRYRKSAPMPEGTLVFVREEQGFNQTVIIIQDGIAYVGTLLGGVNDGVAYAELDKYFSRLELEFNGYFYIVTNFDTLWPSAIAHDAYPLGLIFNRNGSMSWIHAITEESLLMTLIPHIKHNGLNWPVSRLIKLNNVELERFENEPQEVNQWPLRNSNTSFRFIGAGISVRLGERISTPTNFRIIVDSWGHETLAWNNIRQVRTYLIDNGRYNSSTSSANISLSSLRRLGVGTYRVEIVAVGRQQFVRGVLTHFASSEPAVILVIVHEDRTVSYKYPI
ncbi:MAG: hypothetical protein FWE36_01755 [Erysipelotrichales bacterium]|nr:hypothetical protein [Erysipelotrichales bacterium]